MHALGRAGTLRVREACGSAFVHRLMDLVALKCAGRSSCMPGALPVPLYQAVRPRTVGICLIAIFCGIREHWYQARCL
jgi:hypothetical protein